MEKRCFAFRILGVSLLVLLFPTVGYMQDGMLIEDAIASELVPDDSPTAISYYIKGIVGKGTGQVISMHFPHKGLDFREIVTIENDEFVMTGKAERGEVFCLHFENELGSHAYWAPSFLIEDTIVLEGVFQLMPNMDKSPYIEEIDIRKGKLNQGNRLLLERFFANYPQGNKSKIPHYTTLVRDYVLTEYNHLYHGKADPVMAINGLNRVVKALRKLKVDLNEKEKQEISSFFEAIDKDLEPLSIYKEVQQKIDALLRKEPEIVFKDFELEDRESMGTKLSALISEKKVVLVDFWWSGCVPCRQLNKELPAIYEAYKDKGFEIVSISSDRSVSRWEKASEMDKIYWPNLYAGYDSPCLLYYDIRFYPNALILDEKQQIIAKGKLSKRVLLDILKERLE